MQESNDYVYDPHKQERIEKRRRALAERANAVATSINKTQRHWFFWRLILQSPVSYRVRSLARDKDEDARYFMSELKRQVDFTLFPNGVELWLHEREAYPRLHERTVWLHVYRLGKP